ncbi:hypothetical protein LAZ67_X002077 [Cordylochernes scorpioides]|uniref:Reverse transcriptase domain-containing protein n=1 Tax=Cordylochernes scorpioides TaxID=51811 RepID=A0ABY6LX82_9ARAC|nr:hypothetical protein LAZ67_X002077 [Cordylochernes scorpioides]
MALERFIKRRGRPSTIFSDNGTNFVAANNLFKQIDWERVSNDGKVKRIEWKFIQKKSDLKTAKTLLETFLNFNYIEFENKIYIQSEGVPMGTSSSPLLANLILFWYEREYFLQNNINWQIFRYVDDIIIFNNPQFKN